MDGHPEVGADTLARALQLHRTHRAAAAARRAWTGWRGCSRTPRCGSRCRRSSTTRWSTTREELPTRRRAAAPAPRVGAAADQARLRPPPARQHAAPARARARLRRRAGAAARPRARARPPRTRATSRCGAIRRLLWQVDVFGFHLAGIDIRQGAGVVREATAAILPGLRRRRRAAPPGAADRGAGLRPARHRARSRAARRASCCACWTRSRCRADAYGPQAVPAFVISMTEQPSDVLAAHLARRSAPARPRCGWCRCSRRARRSSRRRRRWPSSTPASPTSRTCARRPTARR